jgi:hypothetical protein
MKGKTIRLCLAIVLAASLESASAEGLSWQQVPDVDAISRLSTLPRVPSESIYEVVPTKIFTALAWHLEKEGLSEISCLDASFLVGGHFNCEPGKKPFLVRAVYGQGGTGNFIVSYEKTVLFVFHGSLGDPVPAVNIPLVINLTFTPTKVFAWAGYPAK